MGGNIINPFGNGAKIGNVSAGNYAKFDQDGTLQFKGNATVWDDIVRSLAGRQLQSVAGAVDYDWDENAISFDSGGNIAIANDRLVFGIEYKHALKANGMLNLHIHWEQVSSNDINFTTQYRIQSNGSAKTTAWTTVVRSVLTNSVFTYTAGTLNQITKLAEIDMTGAGISATVDFRLARTDATVGAILGKYIDVHGEFDMLGSRMEFTK